MDTPVPGPHRDSSQSQTATVWGKLFWPSLHPHLQAPRWSTAASQTSESSPHRVERASCRWWATSSWTCDLTRSHKNPYCIYFHSNCLAKDKLPFTKKEQNLALRRENSRIWLRINSGGYLPSFCDVWLRCCWTPQCLPSTSLKSRADQPASLTYRWNICSLLLAHPPTLAWSCVH